MCPLMASLARFPTRLQLLRLSTGGGTVSQPHTGSSVRAVRKCEVVLSLDWGNVQAFHFSLFSFSFCRENSNHVNKNNTIKR